MIQFNKHNVVNKANGEKAKVFYSVGTHIKGKECVTLYEKEYKRNLQKVFDNGVKNESDYISDYVESSRITFFKDSPYYEKAKERALLNESKG